MKIIAGPKKKKNERERERLKKQPNRVRMIQDKKNEHKKNGDPGRWRPIV